MPRLVTKTAKEPILVGDVKICMCGLSVNQPFCDESHLKTSVEDDSKLYWYKNGKVEEVVTDAGNCDCDDCNDDSNCCSGDDCKCGGECDGNCDGDECCGNCKK